MNNIPLIVDLDHTLIDTDLLQKSSKRLLRKNPLFIFRMIFWLSKGKGNLKEELVKRIKIDVSQLPYNQTMLDYIKVRKNQGDKIILATASHHIYANQVAQYLKCFDEVLATDKTFNLSSHNKAKRLVEIYGDKQFDYAGDHNRDIPVWQVSRLSVLVNTSKKLEKKLTSFNTLKL
jgi:phosphoserine phosphatase